MAPILQLEEGPADRAAGIGPAYRPSTAAPWSGSVASVVEFDFVLVLTDQLLLLHACRHLHAEIASQIDRRKTRDSRSDGIIRPRCAAHWGAARAPRAPQGPRDNGDVGIGERR